MGFIHRYHFTGVSNQLQARELFDQFRDSMELDKRYAEIKSERDGAAALALPEEQRETTRATLQLAQEQGQNACAAQTLTEIAAVATVVGVAAELAGVNVVMNRSEGAFALLSRITGQRAADGMSNG